MAHFARDQDNIVSTDASRSEVGITLWQKQNDDTIRPKAFASRYLNEELFNLRVGITSSSMATRETSKVRIFLNGKVVHLYTDHQALEPLI